MEFLRAALAEGERTATDVLTEATALGIAEITLRRARKALGVQVRREGFGKDGRFLLALPSNEVETAAEMVTPSCERQWGRCPRPRRCTPRRSPQLREY